MGERWRSRRDLTLLVFLALGMAGGVASCQLTPEPDRPANTQAAADPSIIHLVGSVRQGGQDHPFDIWLDVSNERFVVDRARHGRYHFVNGSLRILAPAGTTALDYSINEAFEPAAIQALDYFAFVVIPDLRSQLVDLGIETINGSEMAKVRDPLGRTILISEDNLPIRVQWGQGEIRIAYTSLTMTSPSEIPDSVFDNPTPDPSADSVGGVHYRSTDPEFDSIFQFSDYDVYWLGRRYDDWECSRAIRTTTSGPLSRKLAELSQQPGAIDDHFEISYQLSGRDEDAAYLFVTSFPANAVDVPLSPSATVTEISVGQRPAELIDFGESRAIRFTVEDARVYLSTDQAIDLVEAASHIVRLQDGDA
ncbi:MAG: hypothetical protein ACH37Z_09680 [Anaerolineae bacterium]